MVRWMGLGMVLLLLAVLNGLGPLSQAQDLDAERISALETAVAELTVRVEALESVEESTDGPEAEATRTFALNGSIEVPYTQAFNRQEAKPCTLGQENADLVGGLGIVVINEAGDVVGTGRLEDGRQHEVEGSFRCVMPFKVSDLPQAEFYTITIGEREFTFSIGELEERDWIVVLSPN